MTRINNSRWPDPHPVETLRRRFGGEMSDRFIEAFSGETLYIPVRLKPESRLVKALGMEAAAALSEELHTLTFEVPVWDRHQRPILVRRLYLEGATFSEIAKAACVTTRTVRRIVLRLGITRAKRAPKSTVWL